MTLGSQMTNAETTGSETTGSETAHSASTKGRILIVDDTVTNLRVLSTLLTRYDYEVQTVLTGELALQVVQQDIPDLILLDISMPEMDGYEVCRRLQTMERTRTIPVIFISAYDAVTDKVKGFEVGGVDYITKPFHWAEVIARVESQLKIRRLSQQLQRQNTQLEQEVRERATVEASLRTALEKLQALADLDGLTQIANRRRFDQFLEQYWYADAADPNWVSLVLADVDYFKRYNDMYGHLEGDRCLQQVAQFLQAVITEVLPQQKTLLARYGGEEFGILSVQLSPSQVVSFAQTCHQRIHELQIIHQGSPDSEYLTMSFGVATLIPHPQQPASWLIRCADQCLYEAKATGRDRVVAYEPSSKTD
ncbi:MAG: diguanylate cyclase domain-containing protein [Spirulinaceae cyanobacterium]